MDKLKMQTNSKTNLNIDKIELLFPNCVTETLDGNCRIKKVVDFDML
ncbi:MAG: hypothetical protein LBE09_06120 [Christensenellaceae bacterium]|jgi:adenine-specific DNA-methyltransferase|nr:hypothetical protein [Christensenellaceae bacterium]